MVWPFLMIYVSEKLELPLAATASLMTLNAAMGLLFSLLAGPLTDRVGRKWVMVVSLGMNSLAYLFMARADNLVSFAVLMAISGAFNPLYRIGADAMMADLVPAEKRMDAFSLLRTSHNLGIALGPLIGGVLASVSYTFAFISGAAGMAIYGLLIGFFGRETLPQQIVEIKTKKEKLGGYNRILKDRPFVTFSVIFTLTQMCAAIIWVLLGVYAKQNYKVPESLYGLIPATNAVMVVLFQLPVTQITKRYPTLAVMTIGSLFYALAVGSVALGQGFWGFWLSMVIMTTGELILSPTSMAYVANLAPPDMRGRYMSIYGMTWGVAAGIGPVMGGFLNDHFGPAYIWYGGFLVGMISTFGFLFLARRAVSRSVAPA